MPALETIQVLHPNGTDFLVINKSDFDPSQHKTPEDVAPEETTVTTAEPKLAPVTEPEAGLNKEQRKEELEGLHWTALRSLGETLPEPITEKPEDGWDSLIPAILEMEYPEGL